MTVEQRIENTTNNVNSALRLGLITKLLYSKTTPEHLPNTIASDVSLIDVIHENLTQLLNTRRQTNFIPDNLAKLRASIYNYGFPDISMYRLEVESERETVRQILKTTIEIFEPRLQNISVSTLISQDNLHTDVLYFRIVANLVQDELSQPVSFDSLIKPNSDHIAVYKNDR